MRRIIGLLFLGLAFCLFSGCALLSYDRPFTRQESAVFVGRARKQLEAKYPDMDDATRAAIAGAPKWFSYYRVSGDYIDYKIVWIISDNRTGEVWGSGDFENSDDSLVEIREIPPKKNSK